MEQVYFDNSKLNMSGWHSPICFPRVNAGYSHYGTHICQPVGGAMIP